MSIRSLITLCLAAAISLVFAAAAHGASAGDEYVPFVPGAAGKQVVGDGQSGPGSSILSPEVRGSGSDSGSDGQDSEQTSSGQDSSGAAGTLTDPVALLVIVGVGTATLAMTLRRRRSLEGEPAADLAARDSGSSPPTPDGEIAGSDEE